MSSKFTTGILLGAIIGLLFAPQEGKKTRQILRDKADEFMNKPNESVANLKNDVSEKVVEAKENVEKEIKEKVDEVRNIAAEKISAENNTKRKTKK